MSDTLVINVPPQGPRGPQGIPGAAGAQGNQGLVGARGLTGDTGEQGEVGPRGASNAGYNATSATSLALAASGSKIFTIEVDLSYAAGIRVRATSLGTSQWMEGVVTSYVESTDSGLLAVAIDLSSGGTATHTDWAINVAGQPGIQGVTGDVASSRQVLAGGIATGGGTLASDRTITVTKATGAEIVTGTEDGHAVTPKALTDAAATGSWPPNDKTSVSHVLTASGTLILTDAGKSVRMDVATANTLTVPPNADVAFVTDTYINLEAFGVGQTTIVAGAGVTLLYPSDQGLKLRKRYSMGTLHKIGTDEWMVGGDLSA